MINRKRKSTSGDRMVRGSALSTLIGMSHLSWDFEPVSTNQLAGKVTLRSVGPLRLSRMALTLGTNEWSGERNAANIQSNPEPYLNVVMPLDGSITLNSPSNSLVIGKHELELWDSMQRLAFEVKSRDYEQISILVPQRMLRARPEICSALHCAHVDKTNVLSELCVQRRHCDQGPGHRA